MKIVCELRRDGLKKIKIISSIILLLSALFVMKVKFQSDSNKVVGNDLTVQLKTSQDSKQIADLFPDNKEERIIINQESGIIFNSIKKGENYINEKMQSYISQMMDYLQEEQLSLLYDPDTCEQELFDNEDFIHPDNFDNNESSIPQSTFSDF